MKKNYYVYILSNDRLTFYVGVTSNLLQRIYSHKEGLVDSFTKEHKLHKLLYFEEVSDINTAITREKRIKRWNRTWKLRLIRKQNPKLLDLYQRLVG